MVTAPPGLSLHALNVNPNSESVSGSAGSIPPLPPMESDEHGTPGWNPRAPSFVPLPTSGFDSTALRHPGASSPPLNELHPDHLHELHSAAQHIAAELQQQQVQCAVVGDGHFGGAYMDDGVLQQFVMHDGQQVVPMGGLTRGGVGSATVVGSGGVQIPTALTQQSNPVSGPGVVPTGTVTPDDPLLSDLPPFTIVTSMNDAVDISRHIENLGPNNIIALDCEGVNLSATGKLTLVQIAISTGIDSIHCYLFDAEALGRVEVLRGILENPSLIKVIHDVYRDASALFHQHQICLAGILDTQLVYEYMEGEMLASMRSVVRWLGEAMPSKDDCKELMTTDPEIWSRRPLQNALIRYAVNDVAIMLKASRTLMERMGSNMPLLMHASAQRCRWAIEGGLRSIAFCGNRLTSRELRDFKDSYEIVPVQIDEDMESIYSKLQPSNRSKLIKCTGSVQFVILDLGAPSRALYHHDTSIGGRGSILLDDGGQVVTNKHLRVVEANLEGFDSNSRCSGPGVDGTLHRVSCIHTVLGKLSGITFKVGRAVINNYNLFPDILFSNKSILVIGQPNTGKTTMLRELGRKLAEQSHVVCVDTTNEICGDGEKVHRGVGFVRRMPVAPHIDQVDIIREAARNHSPEVLVCDFITDPRDIDALIQTKARGVRIITSASGSLHELMGNTVLHPLLGLGKPNKWGRRIRTHAPLCDVVIECNVDSFNRVRIFADTTRTIDSILQTGTARSEIRHRSNAGEISLELQST
eukprot:GEMP01010010.1.p1 GENE.GEMP01010010.1~~GEMP01010010.1.p1  ORF type:complete len:753 (+),score=166.17 GEMP01010010.1:294-2552(+)